MDAAYEATRQVVATSLYTMEHTHKQRTAVRSLLIIIAAFGPLIRSSDLSIFNFFGFHSFPAMLSFL